MFLPESWDDEKTTDLAVAAEVGRRRARSGIPDTVRHREKWRLALDMLDEITGEWGLPPRPVIADAGYGDASEFRTALTGRGLAYVVAVKPTATQLELKPLRKADVATMFPELSARRHRLLHRAAHGNPLYLQALAGVDEQTLIGLIGQAVDDRAIPEQVLLDVLSTELCALDLELLHTHRPPPSPVIRRIPASPPGSPTCRRRRCRRPSTGSAEPAWWWPKVPGSGSCRAIHLLPDRPEFDDRRGELRLLLGRTLGLCGELTESRQLLHEVIHGDGPRRSEAVNFTASTGCSASSTRRKRC